MPTIIAFKGYPIGAYQPEGKCLEKASFRALRRVDRVRAYLLMVWPASRSRVCLAAATGIPVRDLVAYMQRDLKAGRIKRVARGWYVAVPVQACATRVSLQ